MSSIARSSKIRLYFHESSVSVFLPITCRLVLSQNKKELLVNWYNEGKLEPGEELGDLVSMGQSLFGFLAACQGVG